MFLTEMPAKRLISFAILFTFPLRVLGAAIFERQIFVPPSTQHFVRLCPFRLLHIRVYHLTQGRTIHRWSLLIFTTYSDCHFYTLPTRRYSKKAFPHGKSLTIIFMCLTSISFPFYTTLRKSASNCSKCSTLVVD
jgi:hypothetical protein